MSFFFRTFQHYSGYWTPSSATHPISALRVFTSDLFIGHSVLLVLESRTIWQQAQVQTYSSHQLTPTIVFLLSVLSESYVLILRSFQEKYIPERCFHVCHIMKEKVFPCRPGRQPALPTKQPGHVHRRMGGEITCICLLRI